MSATPGRPRDPAVDRRITQAALHLFADHGWAGFAMEAVARRAGVGKASLYLRWSTKEGLLTDAVAVHLTGVADVDTGGLHGDLVRLATQILQIYAGDAGRAALRLALEAAEIPGVAEQYDAMRLAEIRAARAIVRRGIKRGELPFGTSVTLLLDTLAGGAMMHALQMPSERRPELTRDVAAHARRLVDFLFSSLATP